MILLYPVDCSLNLKALNAACFYPKRIQIHYMMYTRVYILSMWAQAFFVISQRDSCI